MTLADTLTQVLSVPTPDDLWQLRGDMREAQVDPASRAWHLVAEFHHFLDALQTGMSAKGYSNLASLMDIGAVGGIVIEDVLTAKDEDERRKKLIGALFAEGLMILATRQHVKAWAQELAAVYREAAWFLYDEMWFWSAQLKPDLSPSERRQLIDQLLAPLRDHAVDDAEKAVVVGRLFQLLLLGSLIGATA